MKRVFTLLMVASVALTACQKEQITKGGIQVPVSELTPKAFNATIENGSATKACFDGSKMVWYNGDVVTIFAGGDVADRYDVQGASESGSVSVSLVPRPRLTDRNQDGKIDSQDGYTDEQIASAMDPGNPISANVAVYPSYFAKSISEDNGTFTIGMNLNYKNCGDYDPNAGLDEDFPMVAVTDGTDDSELYFKNLYGLLEIPVKGEGTMIYMVTVKGNNGEKISGSANVTCSYDSDPIVEFTEDALDYAAAAVNGSGGLRTLTDEYESIYIPLPPMTFSKGITVTFVGIQGGEMVEIEKTTSSEVVINRSMIRSMKGIDFGISPTILYYKTTDEQALEPTRLIAKDKNGETLNYTNEYKYDANWDETWGVLTFDGIVSDIDLSWAASESGSTLTDFWSDGDVIPDASINIESLEGMFENCNNLEYVGLSCFVPAGVTSSARMFRNCTSFSYLGKADLSGVNDMSEMFSGCTTLNSMSVSPVDSLTKVDKMFYNCSGLSYLDISSLDLSYLESSYLMLDGCTSLEEIRLGEKSYSRAITNSTFGEVDSDNNYISTGIKREGTVYIQEGKVLGWYGRWYLLKSKFGWTAKTM